MKELLTANKPKENIFIFPADLGNLPAGRQVFAD
jgi:hypothetical protein